MNNYIYCLLLCSIALCCSAGDFEDEVKAAVNDIAIGCKEELHMDDALAAVYSHQRRITLKKESSHTEFCDNDQLIYQFQDDALSLIYSKTVPTDEDHLCFLDCLYRTVDLIKNGELNLEGAMAVVRFKFGETEELMNKAAGVFENCKRTIASKTLTGKCELAKEFSLCLLAHESEIRSMAGH